MNKNNYFRILVGLQAWLWASLLWGASVEAKKDGVEVLETADKGSKVLMTLKKGDAVESSERKGMFWQVKTPDGKSGFVSILGVTRKADSQNTSLSKAIRQASQDGRDEKADEVSAARSRSAVMGVRGLDESGETSFAGNVKPNYRMVFTMEDRMVSDKSLSSFGSEVMKEVEYLAEKKSKRQETEE